MLEEGGACIAYTHFGTGFWRDSRLNPEFARLMRRLANLPGWFVPASRLLDYLGKVRGGARSVETAADSIGCNGSGYSRS